MNTLIKNIFLASLVIWNAQPVQATDAKMDTKRNTKWWATVLGTTSASALLTQQIAAKHGGLKENARGIGLGIAGAGLVAGGMYGRSVYRSYAATKAFSSSCRAVGSNPAEISKELDRQEFELGQDFGEFWHTNKVAPAAAEEIENSYCAKKEANDVGYKSKWSAYTPLLVPIVFGAIKFSSQIKAKQVPVS